MIIKDANHFADYANEKLNLHVIYLDKKKVTEINVDDSVRVPGCLSVHHVERVTENVIDTYKNSNYKKRSKIVKSIEYKEGQKQSSTVSTETTQDVLDNNLTFQVDDAVVVRYQIGKQNLRYLGAIQAVSNNILVQFLKRSRKKNILN